MLREEAHWKSAYLAPYLGTRASPHAAWRRSIEISLMTYPQLKQLRRPKNFSSCLIQISLLSLLGVLKSGSHSTGNTHHLVQPSPHYTDWKLRDCSKVRSELRVFTHCWFSSHPALSSPNYHPQLTLPTSGKCSLPSEPSLPICLRNCTGMLQGGEL